MELNNERKRTGCVSNQFFYLFFGKILQSKYLFCIFFVYAGSIKIQDKKLKADIAGDGKMCYIVDMGKP